MLESNALSCSVMAVGCICPFHVLTRDALVVLKIDVDLDFCVAGGECLCPVVSI